MANKINTKDLVYILGHTPSNQNILISGKHGIGKSEIVTYFYTAYCGMKVVPLFIGQMSDPGDIIGLPNKNEETGKTEFMLPYWFPTDGKPIVLFLDELNRARPELLQVVMDLVLNRKIAGKELPNGSIIVSAINSGDEYTLTDLDPALLSRFNVYEFEPTTNEWINWGMNNNVSDIVLDFIAANESYLDYNYTEGFDTTIKSTDRRSWKRVSDILSITDAKEYNTPQFAKMISGVVGSKAAGLFLKFMKDNYGVTAQEILTDFDSASKKLVGYNIIQCMTIIDKVCFTIDRNYDSISNDSAKNKLYSENFKKFLGYMSTNHKEGMSYFVSNYCDVVYPKLNVFMSLNVELDEMVNTFISKIDI